MYYRISLGFFTSLGLVNFLHKIDTQFLFTLENNINRLFEKNAKADVPNKADTQIIFIFHFLAYLNGILRSRGALRTGVISSLYQQSFGINNGTQSLKVNFRVLNKEIEWLEIYLVFGKSD